MIPSFNLSAEQIKTLHLGKTFMAKGWMWFSVNYYEGHYAENLETLCLWNHEQDARDFIALLQSHEN